MNTLISKTNNTGKLGDIANNIKKSIFNKKNTDLFEITFSYNGWFNKTLFQNFAGLGKKIDGEIAYIVTKEKLASLIAEINRYINTLGTVDGDPEIVSILKRSLQYHKRILELTVLGLPFEVEKSFGYISKLHKDNTEKIVKEMEDIERDLFGGNVRDNKIEVTVSYALLEDKLKEHKTKIGAEEKNTYKGYLEQIKNLDTFDPHILDQIRKKPLSKHGFNKNNLLNLLMIAREY